MKNDETNDEKMVTFLTYSEDSSPGSEVRVIYKVVPGYGMLLEREREREKKKNICGSLG